MKNVDMHIHVFNEMDMYIQLKNPAAPAVSTEERASLWDYLSDGAQTHADQSKMEEMEQLKINYCLGWGLNPHQRP